MGVHVLAESPTPAPNLVGAMPDQRLRAALAMSPVQLLVARTSCAGPPSNTHATTPTTTPLRLGTTTHTHTTGNIAAAPCPGEPRSGEAHPYKESHQHRRGKRRLFSTFLPLSGRTVYRRTTTPPRAAAAHLYRRNTTPPRTLRDSWAQLLCYFPVASDQLPAGQDFDMLRPRQR